MAQNYVVPSIYTDISNQYQGYFAFRFACEQCSWQIDTRPIRSNVSTATNVMDIGVGLLGGFWGRAAEAGEENLRDTMACGTGRRPTTLLGRDTAPVSLLP